MNIYERQSELINFVKKKHKGQKRKYTGEPYYHHLINVASMIEEYDNGKINNGVEIALCHDLFEDTDCHRHELYNFLIDLGYDKEKTQNIICGAYALTDEYTKEKYPNKNRKERKKLEAKRISTIPHICQSVKYCDLLDNTFSIWSYDMKFAKVYIKEKEDILNQMNNGNVFLYTACKIMIKKIKELIYIDGNK